MKKGDFLRSAATSSTVWAGVVRWGGRAGTGIGRGVEEVLAEAFEDPGGSVIRDILDRSRLSEHVGRKLWS